MNIPFRLNLEQQKKRAKALFKAFKQNDTQAQQRFFLHHPKLVHGETSLDSVTIKLADAQLVIARELGCKTWPLLREHISKMEASRREVDATATVPNEPANCLHIRCGLDIQQTLFLAGFKGQFLEFSDPLCVGPVSYNYIPKERAQFLEQYYGKSLGRNFDKVNEGLAKQYKEIRNSADNYKHVVLWFEHDTYDQMILIFLLSQYHRFGMPKHLYMVTTNHFPGSARFLGLGQLPPEGLRLLWQSKQQLNAEDCAEADNHWQAYSDPQKAMFHQYVKELESCRLPFFKEAAIRQALEQPIEATALPLTQQLILDLLSDGTVKFAGALFRDLMLHIEPLPFLGDAMYWQILKEMKEKRLVQFVDMPRNWPDTQVVLSNNR